MALARNKTIQWQRVKGAQITRPGSLSGQPLWLWLWPQTLGRRRSAVPPLVPNLSPFPAIEHGMGQLKAALGAAKAAKAISDFGLLAAHKLFRLREIDPAAI